MDPDLPKEAQPRKGGLLFLAVEKYISPMILSKVARPVIMVIFVGWFAFSIGAIHKIEIGLDQKLSMPEVSEGENYLTRGKYKKVTLEKNRRNNSANPFQRF